MKAIKALFSFGIAGLCVLSLTLFAADGSETNVTVEVLIFSGRPNPIWQLRDTNHLATFKSQLRASPEAFKEEPAEWSRLGFAGFRIRGGGTMGLPAEIRIFQGVIKTGHGKEARYLKDLQGLEQMLISEAKKQALEAPVKEAIENYENARKAKK